MKAETKKPERIAAQMLGQAASHSVARALAARKAAGVELSEFEMQEVSGGLQPIIRGIPPASSVKAM